MRAYVDPSGTGVWESGKHNDVVIPRASKHLACKKNGIHLLYKPSVGRGQGRWWVGVVVGVGVDVICLVNSVNERDLSLLTSYAEVTLRGQLLRGTMAA